MTLAATPQAGCRVGSGRAAGHACPIAFVSVCLQARAGRGAGQQKPQVPCGHSCAQRMCYALECNMVPMWRCPASGRPARALGECTSGASQCTFMQRAECTCMSSSLVPQSFPSSLVLCFDHRLISLVTFIVHVNFMTRCRFSNESIVLASPE